MPCSSASALRAMPCNNLSLRRRTAANPGLRSIAAGDDYRSVAKPAATPISPPPPKDDGRREDDRNCQCRGGGAGHRCCLRETVETPDKTAALVTPDRALARRVVAALERWEVRSTIPAATRSPKRPPESSRGSPRSRARLSQWRCWRCSSIRCSGLAPKRRPCTFGSGAWSAPCCAVRGRAAGSAGLGACARDLQGNAGRAAPQRSTHLVSPADLDAADELIAPAAALAPLETLARPIPLADARPRVTTT